MQSAGPAGKVKRVLRPILGALGLLFVLYAGWEVWKRWNESTVAVEPLWVAAALPPAALAMLMQAWGWMALLRAMTGHALPRGPALVLYLDSQMARYTPGKVGLPAVRIGGASKVGVSAKVMAASLLVELASWVAIGTLVGVFWLGAGARAGLVPAGTVTFWSWLVAGGCGLGIAGLCAIDRRRLPGWMLAVFLTKSEDSSSAPNETAGPLVPWQLPLWHLLHWTCWLVAGALLACAVGVGAAAALQVGGILCLAIVLGFLALLAPAGAGVREAVVVAGAAPLLGAAPAVAVGLLARAVSLVGDVLLWGGARWGHLRAARKATK